MRSGAKAGQQIYVTGELGGVCGGLARFAESESKPVGDKYFRHSYFRHSYFRYSSPQARVAVGQSLRRRGVASAMIDLSDGLSTDLEHICEESHVGAEIDAEAIPRAHLGQGKCGRARFGLAWWRRLRTAVYVRGASPGANGGSSSDPDRPRHEIRAGMRLMGADGKATTA